MKNTAFLFLAGIHLLLGCAKQNPNTLSTEWVEHGSPSLLLEGTVGQTDISREELQQLEGWWPYQQNVIGPRSTLQSLRARFQEQHSNQVQKKIMIVYPLRLQENGQQVDLVGVRGDFRLSFVRMGNGRYQLRNGQLIHYSRSHNKEIVSLLIRSYEGGALTSLLLASEKESGVRQQHKTPQNLPTYVYSSSLGSRWRQQDLTISLCGFPGREELALAQQALSFWQAALGSRLQLKYKVLSRGCAPFSDLNTHGIYWARGFKPHPELNELNIGSTQFSETSYDRAFVDSDVTIYESELAKQKDDGSPQVREIRRKQLFYGLLHEIGHSLGLGHQTVERSVMSYQVVTELQPYDRKAIQALYEQ